MLKVFSSWEKHKDTESLFFYTLKKYKSKHVKNVMSTTKSCNLKITRGKTSKENLTNSTRVRIWKINNRKERYHLQTTNDKSLFYEDYDDKLRK